MGLITYERLRKLLHYSPDTGLFTWRIKRNHKALKGSTAGNSNNGYIQITIKNKIYMAHRLVFLYMEGYFPENEIDHINRIKNDNRWINLREVSHQCNMRNSKVQNNNTSGVTGVLWNSKINRWYAQIYVSGKRIKSDHYKEKIDAVKARWNLEITNNFPNCNTTSSAYLYIQKYNKDNLLMVKD